MVTIILALSLMNLQGLIGSQRGLGVAHAEPSSLYPLIVSVGETERVFFATHTSDLASGNWIELSGGTSVELPSLSVVYTGPDIDYERGAVTVRMESSFIPDITYPLSTHQFYKEGDSVSAKFWGSTDLEVSTVSFMLLRASSLSDIKEALDDSFSGAVTKLLESMLWIQFGVSIDSAGDATHSFTAPAPGDYLLVVSKIEDFWGGNPKFYIYSATPLEVVDYTLTVSTPSSVEKGTNLNIEANLIGAPSGNYVYGYALIKESSYSGNIRLESTGSIPSTQLYLNGELMAEGDLFTDFYTGTLGQSYLDIPLIGDKLGKAFDPDELSFADSTTGSTALSTSSLATGDYILLVGVWKDFETRIVGVYQKTVTVTSPYVPPRPRNKLPVADAGPDQKAWVNRTVHFDGSESTDPDGYIVDWGWTWDFGDGETASGKKVSHTYQEPGSYTVTLTVKDNRYGEDSDTCTVKISEPPKPVTDEVEERVPGGETDYIVNATDEANTTVTLDTTNDVTVTIIRYEENPHPDDPMPENVLQIYVDVEVSDPDAVVWPIYVELFYTDQEAEGLDESRFGIYYWKEGVWQRCSVTGVDTEGNIVWAYMTADEASGSPILIGSMAAIIIPPLPPILDNLIITPSELELGEDVTIGFDIENIDSQSITYIVTMQIGELTLLVDVELEAYESKTVSRAITVTPSTVGTFSVTVDGLTGSFTVKTPEPPPRPAEFEASQLKITPEEAEIWEEIEISFTVTNIGEETGNYKYSLLIEGPSTAGSVEMVGVLGAGESETATHTLTLETPGDYTVEVDGLTTSFTVVTPPSPAEFVVSDLFASPDEVEEGEPVTISVRVTNIGETEGNYTVEFKVDGETIKTEIVTLAGGETTTLSLEETWTAGTYQINVEDLTETFTVSEIPPIPFWMQPGTIAGILIIILAIAAILYANWKGILPSLTPKMDKKIE